MSTLRNKSAGKENKPPNKSDYIKRNVLANSKLLRKRKCLRAKLSEAILHMANGGRTNEALKTSGVISDEIVEPLLEKSEKSSYREKEESRTSIEAPSIVGTEDRCKLVSWGLPPTILRKYEARGLTRMFPWQVECLSNRDLLEKDRNLVYSAPTSAGKTLVSEILVIKSLIERRKKVIFILPFVSVVREKMYYFQELLQDSGLRVAGFMGGCAPPGGFAATDLAIATIEKANSLVNQLMQEGELEGLGAVVIDELHLLGDPYRGYLLELLLTKVKYISLREERVRVQLIGMSATLPNLTLLAKWLDAELYRTDFRPVPLCERCKIGTTIYNGEMKPVRNLSEIASLGTDSDNVIQLCIETISDGHSVLIFCPTKNWTETLAQQIATTFRRLGSEETEIGAILRRELSTEAIMETLEQLKRSPAGLDDVLRRTVSFGAAFHHAGLTMDERDVIEGAFRSGALRVLTATSTLSSGVNLPARRVIIRSVMFYGKPLDTLTYRQMIGRAGRMGRDTAGESILVCRSNEKRAAASLLAAELPAIESCLEGSEPLTRALLEAVASEVAYTLQDIALYTKCTLASASNERLLEENAKEAVDFLVENELLMLQSSKDGRERWVATQLGKACLAASMPPSEGLFLFEELQKARKCFVLDTELHVVYLVTPLNSSSQIAQIDWLVYLDLWKSLTESERRVGRLVGVDENFLMSSIAGSTGRGRILNVHKRFYAALALHDLVREVPLIEVCRKYGCCRGLLQSLQQSAATFAGMVTQFCKKLGWNCMELLVDQFQARLQFGVCRELLDLLRLPMLNGLRARSLYKEGITSVAELAVANVLDVERGLHNALPFESGKERDDEYDLAERNKLRTIFVTGRDGLTPQEAAIILVREARTLVQNELGIDDLQWKERDSSKLDKTSDEHKNSLDSKNGRNSSRVSLLNGTNRQNEKTIRESKEYEAKIIKIDENEIVESEAQLEKNLSKTVEKSSPIVKNYTFGDGTFQFTNISRKICSEAGDTERESKFDEIQVKSPESQDLFGSRTAEELCGESIFGFGNTKDANKLEPKTSPRNNEDICTIPSTIREAICQNFFSPSEQIVSKTPEDAGQAEVFKFESTETKSRRKTNESSDPSPIILLRNSLRKEADSRSPSLFGDSLNLDTQDCNILEQNVMESLNSSPVGRTTNTPENRSIGSNRRSSDRRRLSLRSLRQSPRISELRNRSTSIVWSDDSWTNTNGIVETSIVNVSRNEKVGTPKNLENPGKFRLIHDDRLLPSSRVKKLENYAEKRKLSESSLDSPVSLRKSQRQKKSSVGSCKSDSDDVVTPSQSLGTSGAAKNRTRLKLATLRKSKVEKNVTQEVANECNNFLCESCSIGSVILSSDEEDLLKTSLTRKKIAAAKTTKISKPEPTFSQNVESVNVAASRARFNQFKRELECKKDLAIALACEMYLRDTISIGTKIVGITSVGGRKKTRKVENCVYGDKKVSGVAISWDGLSVKYVSFDNTHELKVPVKERLDFLTDLLNSKDLTIRCFSFKETYKILYNCCRVASPCKFIDPGTADWLLDPERFERSFSTLIVEYLPEAQIMLQRIGTLGNSAPGFNVKSTVSSEIRASTEVILTWHLTNSILARLEVRNPTLLKTFHEVEMEILPLLARMELTGLGVNLQSLQELASVVQSEMSRLENEAYALAGRKFNFSSSKSVAQVLELNKGKKVSTNKAVLEHCENPISRLVIAWRKLSSTQMKAIFPVLRLAEYNSRIHGNCVTHTVTGRISMHEPNLQNIPRDFSTREDDFLISVRAVFVPTEGNVLLSADYCQLELRILAHFSKEPTLCQILRMDGDVFKNIAARWHNVAEKDVDDKMRQKAKQLCYAMIYGMGAKSLAETLGVSEPEAKEFVDNFMNTYPVIREWLKQVVEQARIDGHVTTLMARQRFLPALNSEIPSERSQAERQAVNTTIQGSAADIAKKAMIEISKRMHREFPNAPLVLSDIPLKRRLRSGVNHGSENASPGGYLVLHLHDELLYEVNEMNLRQVAIIVKESMEKSCRLRVPLPVKLKVGSTWGNFAEFKLEDS